MIRTKITKLHLSPCSLHSVSAVHIPSSVNNFREVYCSNPTCTLKSGVTRLLDGDAPRSTSYAVYISKLIRFARASSYVVDFKTRNKLLTQKLLKQGYRYHKLRKTFSKFYRQYYNLISKFQVGLKSLLRQGLLEPDFYGDLVYKLKKIVGSNNFSAQFIKIMSHYKKIGYNINVYCNRLHAW